ncbi:TetR/AcrR family transcriptional regulator [Streptomyces iconiensis]|uniref:Helix-turn-helix domain-containing protein n=1 Tax=Streptomyces iconiensis TaxID=1384038 RepID=A0ABT7A5N8_9ACTN|nr:helix-turn-helix domain-containing protein [Streptomyces iconiensis]MDJ1136635.1 helix-turn-helix domain-containing protein [Streptomyces iconiensis]
MIVKNGAQLRILLAAERLFAQYGIDGPSLREIGALAGQRNNSAVQYNFGSREGLIKALYTYRLAPLNQRRLALLDDIRTAGLEEDPHALVTAYVRPLAESVQRDRGSSWYARFTNRYVLSDHMYTDTLGNDSTSGIRATVRLLSHALAHLPQPVLDERLRKMHLLVTSVLADLERRYEHQETDDAHARLIVDDLITTTTALLTAPAPAPS